MDKMNKLKSQAVKRRDIGTFSKSVAPSYLVPDLILAPYKDKVWSKMYKIWRESDAMSYFWEATVLYADYTCTGSGRLSLETNTPKSPGGKRPISLLGGSVRKASIQIVPWDYLQLFWAYLLISFNHPGLAFKENLPVHVQKITHNRTVQKLRPELGDIGSQLTD